MRLNKYPHDRCDGHTLLADYDRGWKYYIMGVRYNRLGLAICSTDCKRGWLNRLAHNIDIHIFLMRIAADMAGQEALIKSPRFITPEAEGLHSGNE